jgi:CheY-like chemotaxis protein
MPRKRERVSISLDVVLEWASGKNQARISDLSVSGCFVDTIATVNEGETISFKFTAPTGELLHLSGTVVYYLAGFGFGLNFEGTSKEQETILEQIVLAQGGNSPSRRDVTLGRVIITNDNSTTLNLTAQIFQAEGCEIVRVKTERDAYFHLQSDTDFIAGIFNVSTDETQALNMMRYMKGEKRLQQIAVIAITDSQDFSIKQKILLAGADLIIQESFNPEQIRDEVRTIIQRKVAEH